MSALSLLLLNQLKLMHVILQTEIQCNMKHEVFVEVNIDLHTESNQRAALIAKLDAGAQGTLLPLIIIVHYVSSYVSSKLNRGWTSKVSTLYTVHSAYDGVKLMQCGTCRITCEFLGQKLQPSLLLKQKVRPC